MHLPGNKKFLALYLSITIIVLNHGAFAANQGQLAKALRERGLSSPRRELTASSRLSSLERRHSNFFATTGIELTYAEGESLDHEKNFVACLHAKSQALILLLEEFEHLADDIQCSSGFISLHLHSNIDFASTRATLSSLKGGLVVTSHYGCNVRGERNVFRITHVDFELDAYIVTLRTETTSWRKSFHSMEIQMGHVQEGHVFRPKNDLRRRQDTIASTGALSFPTVTASVPNATSTASTNTLDVNHSLINKDLLPANSSLQVTCTNCSTYGTIDFSFAQFEFNDNIGQDIENTFTGPLELGDLFTGGEATIVAHGLGAHVELYTNISRTDEKNIDLFQIPLLFGVKLPGVGTAGLLYAPALHAAYVLNGSIGFSYGFELSVPDNSKIFLDLTEPANSSVTGFGDASVNALPFQADIDVPQFDLEVALRHQVQIGFHLDTADVGADIGVYLDLPGLDANITHVHNVDENCTSLGTSQSADNGVAQRVLTDVYEIQPEVYWQVGLEGEAYAGPLNGDFDVPFANGTIAGIPLACLQFQSNSSTYVPASQVVEQAKRASTKNAAGQLEVPGLVFWVTFVGGLIELFY